MTESTLAYLDANYDQIQDRLFQLVSIPSISADSYFHTAIDTAADWLVNQLASAGLKRVTRFETQKNPLVYAEWLDAPGKPTVLIYGHYDVQPVDPLDKWHTEPFQPVIKNGRIYARGTSDDKAPILTAIEVARTFLMVEGKLPVNVKFLFEGEEEIGSPSIDEFMKASTDLLACDFVVSCDGAMWRPTEPSLIVASRGSTSMEFSIYGPKKDLHSGRHGGAVANPLHAMAELLASLHTLDGKVAVQGFYDDVKELSQAERAAIQAIEFDEQQYLDEVGSPEGFGEPGYSLLERNWVRPTLEIVGMYGGYQGEGMKTVLPAEAHAKISCRLVPDQSPSDIRQKIMDHLLKHKPAGIRLEMKSSEGGVPAYSISENHPGLRAARSVLKDLYQQDPIIVRIGATLPIAEAFRNYLKADTVFFSFSTADEDYHAPNEFFRIQRLKDGLKAWVHYFEKLAEY